jgi:phosphoglycolate phosphatase
VTLDALGLRRPPTELVVLDMAGTTVADDGTVEQAFTRAMAELGVEPGSPRFDAALDHVRSTMGSSKIEVFGHIFDGDEQQATEANAAFERAYDEAVRRDGATAIPGAEDAIRTLRDRGVLVSLTTGFSPTTRDLLLDALGWRDLVDLALSPADAGRGRPWPDLVLTALIRLRVSAVAAVAVAGDTASDLWAGSRAGASIVTGVLSGAHDRATLEGAPHTHILDSVADLPDVVAVPDPG